MIVRDEAQDFGQEILALGFGYAVDATAVQAAREEGLPSRHGVRAHDGLPAVSILERWESRAGSERCTWLFLNSNPMFSGAPRSPLYTSMVSAALRRPGTSCVAVSDSKNF